MHFGKSHLEDKREDLRSHYGKIEKTAGVTALRIAFCLLLVVLVCGTGLVIGAVRGVIDSAPDISEANIMPLGNASFIYDADGNQVQKLTGAQGNRVSISIEEIPLDMQHAIVAVEDARFYEHNGIDPSGIIRAFVVGVSHGFHFTEGASTITQQLIKNNVFPNFTKEKNFYDKLQRKIQEQYLAVQIEKQMSKNEIMESYLNTINLGQNCLGVQSASQRYFGKDVSDLTLSECAVIAGITQNPTDYDPVTRPENNKIRRNKVLKNMLEQGYISQKQYDKAMSDDVYARIQATSASSQADNAYSYFVDALTQQVIQDLKDQLGYTDTQAYNAVYSGGLSIYSKSGNAENL